MKIETEKTKKSKSNRRTLNKNKINKRCNKKRNRRPNKIKTGIKKLRIEIKCNELANNLDIRLLKGCKIYILSIGEYVSNGKNLKAY